MLEVGDELWIISLGFNTIINNRGVQNKMQTGRSFGFDKPITNFACK